MNILIMTAAMALAGSSIAVSKNLTESMPVFLANELSLLIAWLVLLPFGIRHFRSHFRRIGSTLQASSLRTLLYWPALQALFGMALFRALTFFGLRHVSAIEGALLTATTPAVMAMLAYFLLGEKPHAKRMAGIVLAVSGVLALNWQAGIRIHSVTGFALILLATACESLLTIFRRMATTPIPPLANTFYIVSFSIIFLLPALFIENEWKTLPLLTTSQWLGCLYLGVVATALAYLCWGYASTRIDANLTGIITAVMPFSGALISVIWLRETFFVRHVVGAIFIISSILVNVRLFPSPVWRERKHRRIDESTR